MRFDDTIPIDQHGWTVVLENAYVDGAYFENPNNNVETVVIDDEMCSSADSALRSPEFLAAFSASTTKTLATLRDETGLRRCVC